MCQAAQREAPGSYGICSGQSGTGTGFCACPSVLPCQNYSTLLHALYSFILPRGQNMGPLADAVSQRHCLTPPQQNNSNNKRETEETER
jgi:hypothetical protein